MISSTQRPWYMSLLVLLAVSCPKYAQSADSTDQQSPLLTLLKRQVLAEGQSLGEVQKFCDRRIAVMPSAASWSDWQREAERIRRSVLDNIVFRGTPSAWRDASRRIEWLETIDGGPGYHIKKLRYEALPGLWIPALLYEPNQLEGRVPVVLNVNGHDRDGKAAPYKQTRCINQAKRGMLALNVEWLGMGQLNGNGFSHNRMNQLDLCGTSGLAVFYLAMERALDLLVDHPHADIERVAMAGLSGGGWQTILLSSLDPRVTLANPVAGYTSFKVRVNHFSDLGDSEQTPTDLAQLADYTHLTAMRAPRPTLLTYNAKDNCCFASDYALQPLLDATLPIFKLTGSEARLRWHINVEPGTHNFERENREVFYKMLGDQFYCGDVSYSASELDSQNELKSAEELNVPLPDQNLDIHQLALQFMVELPSHMKQNAENANLNSIPNLPNLAEVGRIVRIKSYKPIAEMVDELTLGDTTARFWRISMDEDWTVPVVELSRGTPQRTSIVAADGGRTAAVEQIETLLIEGNRVLAVDPFYLGESKLDDRGYLFALLVSSVGARPMGVQAGQLQTITAWAAIQFDQPLERLLAIGPRISLAALVAVACDSAEKRPKQLVLQDSLGSLREIIEKDWSVDKYPEVFCFGLLQHCEIDDLVTLAKPCEVLRK